MINRRTGGLPPLCLGLRYFTEKEVYARDVLFTCRQAGFLHLAYLCGRRVFISSPSLCKSLPSLIRRLGSTPTSSLPTASASPSTTLSIQTGSRRHRSYFRWYVLSFNTSCFGFVFSAYGSPPPDHPHAMGLHIDNSARFFPS